MEIADIAAWNNGPGSAEVSVENWEKAAQNIHIAQQCRPETYCGWWQVVERSALLSKATMVVSRAWHSAELE